jgi:hypothetical protein
MGDRSSATEILWLLDEKASQNDYEIVAPLHNPRTTFQVPPRSFSSQIIGRVDAKRISLVEDFPSH